MTFVDTAKTELSNPGFEPTNNRFSSLFSHTSDSHEAPKMPGVQDNYSIDVTNRFGFAGIEVDSGSDDGIENVDPFAMINDLKKQAETAKKMPKQKVEFKHFWHRS